MLGYRGQFLYDENRKPWQFDVFAAGISCVWNSPGVVSLMGTRTAFELDEHASRLQRYIFDQLLLIPDQTLVALREFPEWGPWDLLCLVGQKHVLNKEAWKLSDHYALNALLLLWEAEKQQRIENEPSLTSACLVMEAAESASTAAYCEITRVVESEAFSGALTKAFESHFSSTRSAQMTSAAHKSHDAERAARAEIYKEFDRRRNEFRSYEAAAEILANAACTPKTLAQWLRDDDAKNGDWPIKKRKNPRNFIPSASCRDLR